MILRIPLALWALTLCATCTYGAAKRRALAPLSSPEVSSLAALKDLGANVDPASPSSHLSRILIPRARACSLVDMLPNELSGV